MSAVETSGAPPPSPLRAGDVGMWLFLASLVMFFGALFSGYVLLRAGSESWRLSWTGAGPSSLPSTLPWQVVVWLVLAVLTVRRAHAGGNAGQTAHQSRVLAATAFGLIAAVSWAARASALVGAGHGPSVSVANGCWFVLTGSVAALVGSGAAATAWIRVREPSPDAQRNAWRLLERYWWTMLAFWLAIVFGLELR